MRQFIKLAFNVNTSKVLIPALAAMVPALGLTGANILLTRYSTGGKAATPEQMDALRKQMGGKHLPLVPMPPTAFARVKEGLPPAVGEALQRMQQTMLGAGAYVPGLGSTRFGGRRKIRGQGVYDQAGSLYELWGPKDISERQMRRGFISGTPGKMPAHTFAHEVGHATGRNKLFKLQQHGSVVGKYTPAASWLAGLAASSPKHSALGAAVRGGLIGGATTLPALAMTLPEEVRASWRGLRAMKKLKDFDKPAVREARRRLLGALGTYTTATLAPSVAAGAHSATLARALRFARRLRK